MSIIKESLENSKGGATKFNTQQLYQSIFEEKNWAQDPIFKSQYHELCSPKADIKEKFMEPQTMKLIA